MPLRLFNSMGRKLVPFRPLRKGEVRMYTCGPTVWNYAHIGNFRTFVFEDVLRRYLKFKGFKVTQVMNITDVEDKIIKGMKQSNMTRKQLCDFYEKAFMEDLTSLNVEKAEVYPRATEHIDEMVRLVQKLLDKGCAYRVSDGSVYYDVSKFERYGALSGIKPSELKAGARVKQDSYAKDEANDFALWKAWDPDDGEVYWQTAFGKGRPGWHIECSAMSMKYLGESFDIHTGGMDNKFPHHENEIAQSEAATGKRFVKYWLHSEFLNIRGEEMHKSVGNVIYLRDLLKQGHDPLTVRLFLMSARYRDPIDLTDKHLEQARAQRARLQDFILRLRSVKGGASGRGLAKRLIGEFAKAMDDDLNTPAALASLFSSVRDINAKIDSGKVSGKEASSILQALQRVDAVLGVMTFEERALEADVSALISEREDARKRRDYARADQIREELRRRGVILEDTPQGPVWHSVSTPA